MKTRKRVAMRLLTMLTLCMLFGFMFKTDVSAYSSYVNYISGSRKDVQITFPYNYGYGYEVILYNRWKKPIARTTCNQYATFYGKTSKNGVYYYRSRMLTWAGAPVSGWSGFRPFTTINGKRYKLKIKSKKNRTVKVSVPKIKGVKSYSVYVAPYPNFFGAKKVKTLKPGKSATIGRYRGGKFTWGWTYFVKIVPKVGGAHAEGLVGTGSFRFIKVIKWRIRRRIIYRRIYI